MPVKQKSKDDAKERLIAAALEVFAQSGFDAATTRMIAAKADVNLAAIPYYFGTKEKLYHAAIETLLSHADTRLGSVYAEIGTRLEEKSLSRKELRGLLETTLLSMFDVLTSEETRPYAPLIMREHMMPGETFNLLYARLMQPMHQAVTAIVARLLDLRAESQEAIIRAQALIGHVIAFLAGRNLLLRRLGKETYTEEIRQEIRGVICSNIKTLFSREKNIERD